MTNGVCDFEENIVGTELSEINFKKWYSTTMFASVSELVDIAVMYLGIANGEYCLGENDEWVYFNLTRNVTLDEVTAFMVRCLEKDNADLKSMEKTFEMAKDKGLVLQTDSFYNNPKKELTLYEFKILLKRFLNMPRGWYHRSGHYSFFDFDPYGTKTYYQHLAEIYTDSFVKRLIEHNSTKRWNPDDRWEYLAARGYQIVEENKSEVNKTIFSSNSSHLTLKSYAIIPNACYDGRYILALEFEYSTLNNENNLKFNLGVSAYQNSTTLYSSYLDDTISSSDGDGVVHIIKRSYELIDKMEDIILKFSGDISSGTKFVIKPDVDK